MRLFWGALLMALLPIAVTAVVLGYWLGAQLVWRLGTYCHEPAIGYVEGG